MRRTLLVLCCAVAPLVGGANSPAMGASGAEEQAIDVRGWTLVGNNDSTVMFIKPEPTPPGAAFRRVLVRFEEAEPFDRSGFASMSNVEVADVDCAGGKTRVIQDTRYTEPNLQGESRVDRPAEPAWRTEAPGSFGAGIIKAACGEALPARRDS